MKTRSGTAQRAVAHAGLLCRRLADELRPELAIAKEDLSPVTIADLASQFVIVHTIRQDWPEDRVMGEESFAPLKENPILADQVVNSVRCAIPGTTLDDMETVLNSADWAGGDQEPFWTLDPIDGTKGYIRGGQYAVALAWIEEGRPNFGVLGCPNLGGMNGQDQTPAQGMIFSAGQGEPLQQCSLEEAASANPRWCAVPRPPKSIPFPEARMCESFESGHADHELHQEICRELGIAQSGVRMDSQCKYAALARGEAHIYLRLPSRPGYVEKIWDHAAGWMLVTEAGGTVTDAEGNPLDFSQGYRLEKNRGVIASCGVDHEKLIEAVRGAMS